MIAAPPARGPVVADPAQVGTLDDAMSARKRGPEPELVQVEVAAELVHRDRATIFRWFRRGLLTRHYQHDFEAGVRRAAVDMNELRAKMPKLLAEPKSAGEP